METLRNAGFTKQGDECVLTLVLVEIYQISSQG